MKNKKHILKRVVACVVVVFVAVTATIMSGVAGIELPKWSEEFVTKASAFSENGYIYTVADGEATITGCDNSIRGDVVIPDTLGGYPVKRIGSKAFIYCSGITSITISDNVATIGASAFDFCTGLARIYWNAESMKDFVGDDKVFCDAGKYSDGIDVIFGDNVKKIPNFLFYGEYGHEPNIKSITIGNSVESIGDYAFYGCQNLISVVIPDSVENIGRDAFDGTTWYNVRSDGDIYVGEFYYKYKGVMPKNTTIEIKDGTKGIAGSAFEDCTGLTDISIPNSVKCIGNSAFEDCTGLKNMSIPDSVTSIRDSAFYNCTRLSEITIPDSVASIGDSAFYNCIGIENISIPESVKTIGKGAFQACRNLAYVLLENGVENIGEKAFENIAIKEMILPDSVTNIGAGAFSKCISLARVTVGKGIDTIKGGYIDNGNYCYGTFENCTNLTTIKLETNIKTIEANAFNGIENIPEIYYAGSEDDWKNISIDQSNDMILRATVQYNADLTHEHSYTETVTTSATCTENGVKTFTCDCGKIYTEEIPATGHTSSEWIEDKAATCVNEGKKHKECTACQTVLENGTISANGHDFESDIIPATCTSIGYETKTCKTCGECHFVRAISANGHTPSDWIVDYDVTCTSDGLRHKECTVCNMIIESETIYAVSHKYRTETTAATCMANGYEIMICADCGVTEFVRSIPAKGHTHKTTVIPATFTESGLSIASCRTCGMITKATLIKRIASVSLSRTAFTYNGKVQTPTVVVKDSAGKVLKYKTDYTVSYASGRKTPGKYVVKITFKGYYAGTKTLYFTIAPATPTLTVTAGAKKAALKWNKQVGATGYVVYMATSKTGKYSRIAVLKGNSAVSYTKTGLTTGKTYYFKVAAYTTSGGSNIYSAFSAVKGIKVK